MIAVAVLAALQPSSITLAQGVTLAARSGGGHAPTYQSVLDTYLDATTPNEAHGGDFTLIGGPGKTILIRFEDLGRIIPRDSQIAEAKLILSSVGGSNPELRSVNRLLVGWGEGPRKTIAAAMSERNRPAGETVTVPRGAATWNHRLAGTDGIAWREPGASGASDSQRVEGAQGETAKDEYTIRGLADAFNFMLEHPESNHGLALQFSNVVEFASSQSNTGRPRLVLTLTPKTPAGDADLSVVGIAPSAEGGFTARIKNVGTAPSSAYSYSWSTNDAAGATIEGGKSLAPGEETSLSINRTPTPNSPDGRFPTLRLTVRATGPERTTRNNSLEVSMAARALDIKIAPATAALIRARGIALEDWVQEQVRAMNDVYFARSRFSFAPEGVLDRILVRSVVEDASGFSAEDDLQTAFLRHLLRLAGVPDLSRTSIAPDRNGQPVEGVPTSALGRSDPFAGLSGVGDTRYEGLVPGLTPIPYEPVHSPLFELNPLEQTGLLSATEVAYLNAKRAGATSLSLPKTLIVRAIDLGGRPLANTELSFFQSADGAILATPPAFTVVTGTSGTALVPAREGGPFGELAPDGGNGVFLVKASRNGVTEWTWLKAWQLMDTFSRGVQAAAIMDLRLNLPGAALEPGNLAAERIASDSANSGPATLAPLVDEDPKTAAPLPGEGGWIQIDLGRDRTVAEIKLAGIAEMWPQFDILTFATGQSPDAALLWVRETDLQWSRVHRVRGVDTLPYRGTPRRFRYLRIVNRTTSPGKLGEVLVTPATVAEGGF
jgi:hypothetical protein